MIDLSAGGGGSVGPGPSSEDQDEIFELRQRVRQMEDELDEARADVGRLRLEIELFTSTDPLTGFVNRSGTLEAIQGALDRLERTGEPFTILAISIPSATSEELDELDLVNRIRHFGGLIGGGLRRLDRVGRLDDDMFVTVLANLGAAYLSTVTDRIHAALQIDLDELEARTAAVVMAEPTARDAGELLAEAIDLVLAGGPGDPVVIY